jgi:hypothetical protein
LRYSRWAILLLSRLGCCTVFKSVKKAKNQRRLQRCPTSGLVIAGKGPLTSGVSLLLLDGDICGCRQYREKVPGCYFQGNWLVDSKMRRHWAGWIVVVEE